MRVDQFLEHHGITENPFGQEDAQTDHVFRDHCGDATRHPAWDKIFGTPTSPSTSIVFGEKGSGKTALRLQIVEALEEHNRQRPRERVFVVEYDDFNPFLDSFRERLHGRARKASRALTHWRLWDHMDAVLSLGVGRLVRTILQPQGQPEQDRVSDDALHALPRLRKRDLLLLDAVYHHDYEEPPLQRWSQLRKKLRYHNWKAFWDVGLGVVVTAAVVAGVWSQWGFATLFTWWVALLIVAGWAPYLWHQARLGWTAVTIWRQIRVFDHLPNTLRRLLSRFPRQELAGQPLPTRDRSDDRYEMLVKLQGVLQELGFTSIVVLVDRVDEPHLVNGSPERMRDLLWPLFDNKFLKFSGMGLKLLLPVEVVYYVNREDKSFYERSRLDKQNLVQSLEWSGESLYDVANDRIRSCTADGKEPVRVVDLFEEGVSRDELIAIFARLRVPRHLFKYLYRLLVDHCNRYAEENAQWAISREVMQSTLAVYQRDMEAGERGMGTG